MIESLKRVILDFQEIVFQTGVSRRLEIDVVPGRATICIGVRRSGKSTYLYQLIGRLLSGGVARENILYLNFFDDRLFRLQREGLGAILEAYYSLYPEKKGREMIYCFFDEIQEISNWEPFVERLMRTERCEVYLTGSSARMLSREIATQMRGRALSWEIFPFSFREFLDCRGIDSVGALSTRKQLLVRKAFGEYREVGGFPETTGFERRLRIKTHQEYFNAVLFRDLVERYDVSHPRAVKDLAIWLVNHVAALYSINNLTAYLKSLGHRAPKSAVADYLEWFEDAYFFFTVRIFDASLRRANANSKKIYCVDHALVTSVSSGILVNAGHLLENLVFTALRRVYATVCYYRTQGGREVDFIVQNRDGSRMLVQVCETLADVRTRKREVRALTEAMQEQELAAGFIVTREEEEFIEADDGTIEILPAWRFLLDLPEEAAEI